MHKKTHHRSGRKSFNKLHPDLFFVHFSSEAPFFISENLQHYIRTDNILYRNELKIRQQQPYTGTKRLSRCQSLEARLVKLTCGYWTKFTILQERKTRSGVVRCVFWVHCTRFGGARRDVREISCCR